MRIILILILTLSGCALLDAFMVEESVQARDEHGRLLYQTPEGEITTLAADPQTGAPYQPHTVTQFKPQTDRLNGFGPWGALIGALTTLAAGCYARARNRQRMQAQSRLTRADSALAFALQLIEQIKEGRAVNGNGRGEVSLAELKEWVRNQGSRFEDSQYLAEAVKQTTKQSQ